MNRLLFALFFLSTCCVHPIARGDEVDLVAKRLDAATATYEKEKEILKKVVIDLLDKREATARNSGDKKLVDQIKVEREAFVHTGTLPKTIPNTVVRRFALARSSMEAAYSAAIKQYVKEKKDAAADATEKALAAFKASESAAGSPPDATNTANLLNKMKIDGTANTLPDGTVELKAGSLTSPADIRVPFRADMEVKTTSNLTSIRIRYSKGILIFNWEDNSTEFRYMSPATGATTVFKGKGSVPVGEYIHITWILTQKASQVLVNGSERASIKEDIGDLSAPLFFAIHDKNQPGLLVKSVTITSLAEKH